jgi:tripartite-type tricarboxylate transporter receptor subunit TctC
MIRLVRAVAATLCLVLAAAGGHAQSYPTKPVHLIVPYPAGGSVDALARLVGTKFAESRGQPVVIDNRPGAGGNLGVDLVAKAPADGYTILINTIGTAISPALYAKLPYDALHDLTPVTQLVSTTLIVAAAAKVPVGSMKELIAAAKQNPGKLNYGHTGAGNPLYLTMETLKLAAGIDIVPVTYKGDAPLLAALTAGEIDLTVTPTVAAVPLIQDNRIKALAVTTARRSPQLPDIPTVAESVVPGFDSGSWIGLFVPAGTPAPVVMTIYTESKAALAAADVAARLNAFAYEPVASSPDEFAKLFNADIAKFKKLVQDAHIPMLE